MAFFGCFTSFAKLKKKDKGDGSSSLIDRKGSAKSLQIILVHPVKPSDTTKGESIGSKYFGVPTPPSIRVQNHEGAEVAYEREDEQDKDEFSKKVYCSNSGFGASYEILNQPRNQSVNRDFDIQSNFEPESNNDQSEHLSDPGIGKAEFWALPKLKRSCSNLEMRSLLKKSPIGLPLASNPESFEDLQKLGMRNHGSPASVRTKCSADKVILKKHSSSQILPSGSRRLWWKLFLWSHRNLNKKLSVMNQQGGYSSDTLEPNQKLKSEKFKSPSMITGRSLQKECINECSEDFHGVSGLWPQNQWVAFPAESSASSILTRVEEWVKGISPEPPLVSDNENEAVNVFVSPPSPDRGNNNPATLNMNVNLPEEIVYANSVIQSLNSSSTVAHISGMGLKVIPNISHFSSLRTINLSRNLIVQISSGSLPKSLHTLDLSRNKISAIEGLRDLTRLRILDLCYNRISRIGRGLSNCTLIKELYLAGNKISNVEGLHRLLKLTILDLSFNKITSAKALGQLVANYNTLLALNLLGNPVQTNIFEDQMRKSLSGLLPKLAYLNKQPINSQKAREVATESVNRAALGKHTRRRAAKRVSCGGSSSSNNAHRNKVTAAQKSKERPKGQTHHHSPLKNKSPALASSGN